MIQANMTTAKTTTAQLSERVFQHADQQLFASLSGDVNPMHMDDLAARRTQAGSQVVHGVHAFLWAIENWLRQNQSSATIVSAKARFNKFLLLGQPVAVLVAKQNEKLVKLALTCDGLELMTITLKFGDRTSVELAASYVGLADKLTENEPDARSFEQMDAVCGWLSPPVSLAEITEAFPNGCETFSPARVAAIMQLSTLVGMHNPGLHSVFSSFAIDFVEGMPDRPGIGFETTRADERFRMVVLDVAGSGIQGSVETFARQEPVVPPTVKELSKRVDSGEFENVNALIVGGSRGLGAATAKLIAAGGGKCVITYARGYADAEKIATEINDSCGAGTCQTIQYDARQAAEAQIANIQRPTTDLHYFATPQIFRQKTEFSGGELQDFIGVYVTGFHDICVSLIKQSSDSLRNVFYPSSVAVEERPKGMLEYAMAKMAGEMLCREIDEANPNLNVHFSRIPRTTTDQTATVSPVESADPIDIMLPVLRQMHSARTG